MNIYLYTVNNLKVNKTYKYLVQAESTAEAIRKMRFCDGGTNDKAIDEFVSCELQAPVESGVWYLPDYTPQ